MLEVQVIMLVKLLGYIGVIIVGDNREIVCMKLSIAIGGVIFNNQPHQSDRYVNN